MSTLRVAILDEYPVTREALASILDGSPGFSVVLTCASGAELLEGLASRPCDVVVAEPWLRTNDGLGSLVSIVATMPAVTVVAFSRMWDENRVNQVLALGVSAYVPKSAEVTALTDAIRSARDGLVTRPAGNHGNGVAHALTARELEVLGLAADGLDNAAIGRRLFVTERTVKFHLQNAYRKLGAGNRTEAAAMARRAGLLS